MENVKRKRGRPPKQKVMEFEGMTYEGAINSALDKKVKSKLDNTLSKLAEFTVVSFFANQCAVSASQPPISQPSPYSEYPPEPFLPYP